MEAYQCISGGKSNQAAPSFRMRQATMDDAELLLAWRNDPAVREASFSTAVVELEGHKAWLASKFGSIRIAEVDGVPVGQVRVDGDTVSYSVAAEYRGKGYGTQIIRSVMRQPLVAMVKHGNVASQHVFERLGWMKRITPEHIVYTYE